MNSPNAYYLLWLFQYGLLLQIISTIKYGCLCSMICLEINKTKAYPKLHNLRKENTHPKKEGTQPPKFQHEICFKNCKAHL